MSALLDSFATAFESLQSREAAGLACASRTSVVFEGRGPGRNVGLVPVRSWFGLIDTQDRYGLLVGWATARYGDKSAANAA